MSKHIVADDEFGKVSRKMWEISRRVLEGTLNLKLVLLHLQKVIDKSQVQPVRVSKFRAVRGSTTYLVRNWFGDEDADLYEMSQSNDYWTSDWHGIEGVIEMVKFCKEKNRPEFWHISYKVRSPGKGGNAGSISIEIARCLNEVQAHEIFKKAFQAFLESNLYRISSSEHNEPIRFIKTIRDRETYPR
jgi:hypothetical protein